MQVTDEMVETGCIGMYGKNWNGPDDKRPNEAMKNVWRGYARNCLTAVMTSMWRPASKAQEGWSALVGHPELIPTAAIFENGLWRRIGGSGEILEPQPTHFMLIPSPPAKEA